MTHLNEIPTAAALVIAVFLVLGATLTLIGNLGLLRLGDFFQRLHAPTLGASWGTASIALASMLTFGILRNEVAVHELVIGVFIMITTPIGLLLLGRAARERNPAVNWPEHRGGGVARRRADGGDEAAGTPPPDGDGASP